MLKFALVGAVGFGIGITITIHLSNILTNYIGDLSIISTVIIIVTVGISWGLCFKDIKRGFVLSFAQGVGFMIWFMIMISIFHSLRGGGAIRLLLLGGVIGIILGLAFRDVKKMILFVLVCTLSAIITTILFPYNDYSGFVYWFMIYGVMISSTLAYVERYEIPTKILLFLFFAVVTLIGIQLLINPSPYQFYMPIY